MAGFMCRLHTDTVSRHKAVGRLALGHEKVETMSRKDEFKAAPLVGNFIRPLAPTAVGPAAI
jgi:hypothetical protein